MAACMWGAHFKQQIQGRLNTVSVLFEIGSQVVYSQNQIAYLCLYTGGRSTEPEVEWDCPVNVSNYYCVRGKYIFCIIGDFS